MNDGAVLGFQVEHEDTVEPTSLNNHIFAKLRQNEKYAHCSDDKINDIIDRMDSMERKHILNHLLSKRIFIFKSHS